MLAHRLALGTCVALVWLSLAVAITVYRVAIRPLKDAWVKEAAAVKTQRREGRPDLAALLGVDEWAPHRVRTTLPSPRSAAMRSRPVPDGGEV